MPGEDYEDAWRNDPTMRRWIDHVLSDTVPKMADSALVAQLVPEDGPGDVKFWVELGASIMLDKPIIAIAFEGKAIPRRLRLIADEIAMIPDGASPESQAIVSAALDRLGERVDRGELPSPSYTNAEIAEAIKCFEAAHEADERVTPWAIVSHLEGRCGCS